MWLSRDIELWILYDYVDTCIVQHTFYFLHTVGLNSVQYLQHHNFLTLFSKVLKKDLNSAFKNKCHQTGT